ncbi:hypothetical protein, partial [Mycoplasma sp. CSL7503-lung]|uniref:hypothetical protein n=1 Tax=Mycoplasma sp. CSL7503-lung TaxID=536372 RepID=UPI0021D2CE0B
MKKHLILLTIAGVTAAVAIPVSVLTANKVKKDQEQKNVQNSNNNLAENSGNSDSNNTNGGNT